MKLSRIAFRGDAPNPGSDRLGRGDWLPEFSVSRGYDIVRDGDTVTITHVETGRTFVYPWASTAGAEVFKDEPQTGKMTLSGLAASTEKLVKR